MRPTESEARRRQLLVGAAIGLASWVVIGALQLAGVFAPFDHRLLDWRFRLRGERDASDIVAMVSIDDATVRAFGSWPLPRDQYALLLTALTEAGALAIGVDLQLPEDGNHDPAHNTLLAFLASEQPNIVHAISFFPAGATPPDVPSPAPQDLAALLRHGVLELESPIPEARAVALPFSELVREASALAHITVHVDSDGTLRRLPPLVRYEGRVFPAMALRMVGIGLGKTGPPGVREASDGVRVGWGSGAEWSIPLDAEGALALDFAGDRAAFSNAHSMIEILRIYRKGDLERLRRSFEGRYVLVGLDSRTEVPEDIGATPFAAVTPMVLLHANFVENLVRGRFLVRPHRAAYLGLLAAVAVGLGLLSGILPLTGAALAAAGLMVGAGLMNFLAFAWGAIDMAPLPALALPPLVYAGSASARYLFLERRSRIREADIREGRTVQQQFLPEALLGQELGRYRIADKIGRGGMGVVYRAIDPRLDREVALKVLPGGVLADDRARKRFRREAKALSRLNHPHIAGILDFDTQEGLDFLVMEFVRGAPLGGRTRRGPMPENEILRILRQVSEALAEAHARGVIHRDLKPDNIMIGDHGGVKVLDFGLALFTSAGSESTTQSIALTEAGHIVGTIPYMAPEVIRGRIADERSDLYSLGVVAFEMATGLRPFPDDEPQQLIYTILHQSPPSPRIVNGRISPGLDALILRLLAKEPDQRVPSAADVLAALESCLDPSAVSKSPRHQDGARK